MNKTSKIRELLAEKKLFKVIAGMENFDTENIKMVVESAVKAGASAVDISADSEVIAWVKENYPELIVFVSSLSPAMLVKAQEWGADVLELGNFDAIYTQGKTIEKEEVINLTRELRQSAGDDAFICVTIPATISLEDQINLSFQVQAAGADLLQVENLNYDSNYENAKAIIEYIQIPVLLSGRIDNSKIEKALSTGVNAIGVGNAINSKKTLDAMITEAKSCSDAIIISNELLVI